MALVLALKRGAVSEDLDYYFIEDNTGTYDAATNPTGYGTINPDRNTLALFVYGYKYIKNADDTAIAIGNTIPLTVTQWQIPMTADGFNYFVVLGIPLWSAITNYVFDVDAPVIVYYNNNYYRCLDDSTNQDPISNPTLWELLTDMTTAAIATNTTIYATTFNTVLNYRAKICYQTQVYLEAANNCACDHNNRNEVRPYQKIFVMLSAAGFLCAQQKYAEADDQLVSLNLYCESINCATC